MRLVEIEEQMIDKACQVFNEESQNKYRKRLRCSMDEIKNMRNENPIACFHKLQIIKNKMTEKRYRDKTLNTLSNENDEGFTHLMSSIECQSGIEDECHNGKSRKKLQ